jgi:1,4-alpha-glucan branching enzyme
VLVINPGREPEATVMTAAARPDTSVPVATGPLQPVANNGGDALPVLEQFVFYSRSARSVSVVGDFNGWDASRARMTRASDGDLWSITMPVVPGRHLYGFMVNDSSFVLDPHTQKARDTDLGTMANVIVVGKP